MLDNTDLVRPFVPPTDDGDTFVYTELLDRTKKKGNNGVRIVKTFYHRSQADFDRHLPAMKSLCDATKVRAYTRRGGTLEGWEVWGAVSLHKDNGTNLYIPDDAA
jgi:hypothetical protein